MSSKNSKNNPNKDLKLRKRSKKYSRNFFKIKESMPESGKFELADACKLLFELEQPNYKDGATVELHFKLNINPTKSDQLVRSSVVLPHGTGKKLKIAAIVTPEKEKEAKEAGADVVGGEELIAEIKKSGSVDFDKVVAEPKMMPKLPAIARILGVAGVMPSPKTGTVGENVGEIIKIVKAGKVDFKNDKTGNLHFICGKINSSFTWQMIQENIQAIIEAVEKAKPEVIKKKFIVSKTIATTLSPAIKIV
jgi:large subunit ribosomal protein L1